MPAARASRHEFASTVCSNAFYAFEQVVACMESCVWNHIMQRVKDISNGFKTPFYSSRYPILRLQQDCAYRWKHWIGWATIWRFWVQFKMDMQILDIVTTIQARDCACNSSWNWLQFKILHVQFKLEIVPKSKRLCLQFMILIGDCDYNSRYWRCNQDPSSRACDYNSRLDIVP